MTIERNQGCDRGSRWGGGSHTMWQPGGGVLAVTKPRDETRREEGGVDPITVETIGNCGHVWTRRLLKVKKRVKKSTVAC